VSGRVLVDYPTLTARADALERMAAQITAIVPEIACAAARSGLHELVGYGLLTCLPVAADLAAVCLPGAPGSLPDIAAEMIALAAAVRAAAMTYVAVDGARWARSELPVAEALLMLVAWNRLHRAVFLTQCISNGILGGSRLPATWVDRVGNALLERSDRWIEGPATVDQVDPATMPPLTGPPAAGLDSLLGVVDTIEDALHPSTVALLHIGDDPPRYVLCLPGLQDATGADSGAADLPGAIATLTGHSSYIRGMRDLLATLPAGSQVLLVGHSQGGMVAEALAERQHVGVGGRVTIAGVLTAGAPLLASAVPPSIPYLALENASDPVPRLRDLADGPGDTTLTSSTPTSRTLVRFRTGGTLPGATKHGLGSGGYLAVAGSADPQVQDFRDRMKGFLTTGPVGVSYLQVTDTDGALPP
jgi:pimeloyl-ACP methyl ester carboxylesterase